MPTVAVDKAELFERLGKQYSTQEFDELCFEFGIELDEDTTNECLAGERPQLKIDIPANRYDLLCIEGIARALNVFLGRIKAPEYKLTTPDHLVQVIVEPELELVRPYVAGAILRNVHFSQQSYDSFIALQDKLHANICRNRSLVAIGTHDLDKMAPGSVRCRALPPKDIAFVPLNQTTVMHGDKLAEYYAKDKHISRFVPLLEDKPVYPLFVDKSDTVMSMPPIINSEKTKISLDTTNVFVDLTATDKTKLEVVVNTVVAMFSEYCGDQFTIEPVQIVSPHNNQTRVCPAVAPRTMSAEVDYLRSVVGVKLSREEICSLLTKMCLTAKPNTTDAKLIDVSIPCTRSDILHQCDIMEDLAIAVGYQNLDHVFPANSYTIANPYPINKVADIFRREAAQAGWIETMPLTLCSHDENFKFLNKQDQGEAVHLANPKTQEYQVVRTTLLPGLLKTIRENRKHSLPFRVFEAGDVVFKDTSKERQASNRRHFTAVFAGKTSGFEIVHGLLDRQMQMMRVPWSNEAADERGYWIAESTNPTYFPGRCANVYFQVSAGAKPQIIGSLGVVHPDVMANFEIPLVASALELDVAVFL